MDRWNAVPETYQDYIRLCKLNARRNLPSEIKEAATREFGEDLDQEVLALAWEAFQKHLTIRVAGLLFRNSSIKTRIETCRGAGIRKLPDNIEEVHPLKQGLKLKD